MHLLPYRATGNLGDAIQTVALEQLLGGCSGYVNRDAPSAAGLPLIINGWLGDRWQAGDGASIYAGVHLATPSALQRMVALRPALIGARDPATAEALAANGIEAPVIGCATLTLPRYTGPRSGILVIDYPAASTPPEAENLTHWISPRLPWPAQLAAAHAALQRYRTAEAVSTTRLHVILPCLAFGTPVTYPANADPRFSILQDIVSRGFSSNGISHLADRYLTLLRMAPHNLTRPT